MTDTASSILLLRLQSTGSNTNLWGGYINTSLQTIEQASKGWQTLAVTGNATITWTNYSTGNTGQCAHIGLTGSLTSPASLTFPSIMNWMAVQNNSGATVTILCSGGVGVAIPNARRAIIYCNGTDYFSDTPTWTADSTTLTNNGDLVNFAQLNAAIATAVFPATPGTILNSAADTTAGYLSAKLTGTGSVIISTTSPGGNEKTNIAVGSFGLTLQSERTSGFTAVAGNIYPCNWTTAQNITLPASASQGDTIGFDVYGTGLTTWLLNGLKYYAATVAPSTLAKGVQIFRYSNASNGWIDV